MDTMTYPGFRRLQAKQDEIADVIREFLPRNVKDMHQFLSDWLVIDRDQIIRIEATCLMHTDYLSKFSLRLAEEYFDVE